MYLLFDIGGTSIRLAYSKDGQGLGDSQVIPTPTDFAQAISNIKKAALQLTQGGHLKAAVGGVRALDHTKTKLLPQPHFPLWVGKPLKIELEKALETPVYLENDAAMSGLGEAVFGAGQGYRIVAFITVSTGIGGARIVRGKIDQSALGFEPGNQIIDSQGHTWEALASGEALRRKFGQNPPDITDSEVWGQVAKLLGIGLANVTVFWSPEVIVLGGSIMKKVSLSSVENYLKDYLKIFPVPPKLVLAKLAGQEGLYGALAYAQKLEI